MHTDMPRHIHRPERQLYSIRIHWHTQALSRTHKHREAHQYTHAHNWANRCLHAYARTKHTHTCSHTLHACKPAHA